MAKSNEPFWWAFFSAGMMVGALLLPALIIITGILIPLGLMGDYDRVYRIVTHPVTRALLFVVISLSLFHWAHRFRFTLVDLGLKGAASIIAVVCYGTAVIGTILAGVLALGLI